ncbi:hypothetical protein COBT_003357, partial [Conglomerata obtusa]
MNSDCFSPPKSVFANSEFLDLISRRHELHNCKDVIKRFFTGSLEDENIIDMQLENSALSNNKIKKQISNDYKDDFNNKNMRKQGSQALNKNNNNYNNNGNICMIKPCSKDIIARFNQYKTNLKTVVKKSHENNKRIKKLEIDKAYKNKLEIIIFYSYKMLNRKNHIVGHDGSLSLNHATLYENKILNYMQYRKR